MYKIKQAVIVEGRYDFIKLSNFLDAVIIKTNGFSIMKNQDLLNTLNTLALKTGIVILTDSDSAGFRIRNFIKQYVTDGEVLNAYIPDIPGKEKRKTVMSKEGLLGVEGVDEKTIISALKNAGCTFCGEEEIKENQRKITKTDLFLLGLSGGEGSSDKRLKLCKELGLPSKISANMLVNTLNRIISYEELVKIIKIEGAVSKG